LKNKDISKATMTKNYKFTTKEGRKKNIPSTDDLLGSLPENGIKILGGKTGYLEKAGYCFVGKSTDKENNEILTVILGAKSDRDRFNQTEELTHWVYSNYAW